MKKPLSLLLRGTSQVMLQNNLATGLLFLTGIFVNSWLMGIGAILGNATSTITGYLIKGRNEDINQGLYGFNGTLVGIAALYFFEPNASLIITLIIASALSSLVMKFMHEKKLAPSARTQSIPCAISYKLFHFCKTPYTFPFVFSTWILIAIIKLCQLAPEQIYNSTIPTNLNVLSSLSMGFGQVMFQGSIITGLFFFLALLVNSKRAAVYGFIGSTVGLLIAFALGFPLSLINIGIFGFNGVLCGIAFSAKEAKRSIAQHDQAVLHQQNSFSDEKSRTPIWALFSIALSVFIIYGFIHFNLPALTFPFVLATWITIGVSHPRNNL